MRALPVHFLVLKAVSSMRKRTDPNIWFQQALKVTEDPAASGWLKNALIAAINRDPVDAAGDATVLSKILQQRAAAIQPEPIPSKASAGPSKATLA
jgi:hypothetical protein